MPTKTRVFLATCLVFWLLVPPSELVVTKRLFKFISVSSDIPAGAVFFSASSLTQCLASCTVAADCWLLLFSAPTEECWQVSGEPQSLTPTTTVYRLYLPQDVIKLFAVKTALSVPAARTFCTALAGVLHSPMTGAEANHAAVTAGTWAATGVELVGNIWVDSRGMDVTSQLALLWAVDQPAAYTCARVGYPSEFVLYGSRCTTKRKFMCEIDYRF